ncbi:response regulator with CheY-like receiver domain and winged-helix DNA-binding domain [Terriglobus roseus DSM 18391]|uniref:Response regulator with CheY-like receiver domain and winged-helix DNA-binding domain n=1 Tax=Terriglobus roseus (strain DSM 18391 / NRRL B-41598 / KBS 63) TaxID=926566 RepID=I3ZGG5_TERRK|nr:response regulator transcription factor [Terriglobus roseus]AFL88333.1 response regulator with CheY-like receiver domain and winged-helix DNA-binding domain [Terriglobus roseus DSM 18391]AFL88676.1 response regulator with CheY-like receiver domain and winged-helix DNA-binding domain [Terriglobus roseus DSM 18391]
MTEAQTIQKDRVLVIDDDVKLCSMLRDYLTRHGWDVTAAHTGASGMEAARRVRAELVVLDVMLPDFDGFEVLRRLQREMNPHVLLLTARGEEIDRIVGLEMGADDYLPKPFNPRELLARMRAVVRRAHVVPRADMPAAEATPGFAIDPLHRQITFHGRSIDLTDVEYLLLRIFLSHPGEVLNREVLCIEALERPHRAYDRSVDMHVSRLRKKLEVFPLFTGGLIAIRSTGYLFSPSMPVARMEEA